jgi:hypothetical protein
VYQRAGWLARELGIGLEMPRFLIQGGIFAGREILPGACGREGGWHTERRMRLGRASGWAILMLVGYDAVLRQ